MTKMDEASNPCGGDIEAEMCQLMREQPPAEGVVDRVALQRHRNVALITLSHPQAQNALNLASWRRLKRLLDDLAGESGLRAVVLRGAGDKAFAAGADIKEFPNTRMSAADAAEYNESLAVCLRALTTMPIPVIAAVRGLAVGGGCELATACDVCIAPEQFRGLSRLLAGSRRGDHGHAERLGGVAHPVVVGAQPAQIDAEPLRRRQVDGIERAQLEWQQPTSEIEDALVDAQQIEMSQRPAAGFPR